ncbi:MAG: metallophosphoesterase [Clostridia bacterium]|nr:metallophosphoesterase [Clostridia bacterium]
MISVWNVLYQLVFKIMTLVLSLIFSLYPAAQISGAVPPQTPSDFTPVVRFAVCSDVHISGSENCENTRRFADLFEEAYNYAETDEKYNNLDAVIVAGDFTGRGDEAQYIKYTETVENHLRQGTQIMTILGNHEFMAYRGDDASAGYDMFKKYVSGDVDFHTVINGYHFIGVSYDDNGKTLIGKAGWLKQQLDLAAADTGDKPIFVIQHPHPTLTVFGSLYWGCVEIRAVLEHYPQVVDFSGHSHYAPSDPRCVWQGSFTAVGTGAVTDNMGNPSYIKDKDTPYDSSCFWIVEADEQGSVRLQLYDLINRSFFEKSEHYMTDLANKSNRVYSWKNQRSLDTPPQFPAGAAVSCETNNDGTVTLCFPDAAGYYEAENYKITVYSDIFNTVWSETVIASYASSVKSGVRVNIGSIESGTYSVRVTAYSPYAERGGTLYGTISIKN